LASSSTKTVGSVRESNLCMLRSSTTWNWSKAEVWEYTNSCFSVSYLRLSAYPISIYPLHTSIACCLVCNL